MLDYSWSHNPPPIQGLLLPTGIEPTPFRNLVSKEECGGQNGRQSGGGRIAATFMVFVTKLGVALD